MTKTLREQYMKDIAPALLKELSIGNMHAAPVVEKAVVNIGLGRMSQKPGFEEKILPEITKELSLITGQIPSRRIAKKSIAGFKLREGSVVGLAATLRGARMYDFIERLVRMVLPRVRDFRGVDLKNVDQRGNLNLGFREHVVFPEINQDVSSTEFGLQVTLVTKARNRDEAVALYRKLGVPFKKQ